jgi:uncharacterized cupin superfamily protein
VRIGADSHEMRAGDYVCFPAGQKAGHCLVNNSDATCRYVIVGERNPREVAVYTDSNKVLVRALGRRTILDLAATRGYWDGENTGLPKGEAPPSTAGSAAPEPAAEGADLFAGRGMERGGAPRSTRFGGRSRHLTACRRAGLSRRHADQAPAPGGKAWPRHYHMLEEEHA